MMGEFNSGVVWLQAAEDKRRRSTHSTPAWGCNLGKTYFAEN